MNSENKTFETGSNPYHLNLNSTAKDFSFTETTNPGDGLLDLLSKYTIIEDEYEITTDNLDNNLVIK